MVVGDDAWVVFFGKKSKQAFAINGLGCRLAQMQYVQTLLEQCSQNLVFFYEKVGATK
jgi:hypothetical protein